MELSSVKSMATAYQGSGLEVSATQKGIVETKVIESAESEKTAQESSVLEVQEPNRNESVKRAVEQINRRAKNSEAVFGIHEETNRVTIKIVDKETKEVIKEFPPEETLDMIAKVWELAGLMVDEKR